MCPSCIWKVGHLITSARETCLGILKSSTKLQMFVTMVWHNHVMLFIGLMFTGLTKYKKCTSACLLNWRKTLLSSGFSYAHTFSEIQQLRPTVAATWGAIPSANANTLNFPRYSLVSCPLTRISFPEPAWVPIAWPFSCIILRASAATWHTSVQLQTVDNVQEYIL